MFRIPLVRIIADQLAIVHVEEGLPDGFVSIGDGFGAGTVRNVADELEGFGVVGAGIQLDVRLAEIFWSRNTGQKDRSCWIAAKLLRQSVEVRLVAETPAIDLVVYAGEVGPGCTAVRGLVNGEVLLRPRNWIVVFP